MKRRVNCRKERNLLRHGVLRQFEFLFAHVCDVSAVTRADNNGNGNQIGVYLERLNVLRRLGLGFGWNRGLRFAHARRLARRLSSDDRKRQRESEEDHEPQKDFHYDSIWI